MSKPFYVSQKGPDGKKLYRLEDMDIQFVSLVTAGANRQKKFQVLKADDSAKVVPADDASNEDKRAAQEQRSKQYGIEALEANANLSYPSGDPTTESMYGDPVNLKYPFGKENNERDAGRIRNAISRFKQQSDTYTTDKSKGLVYERIVRAALAEGIDVSYDSEDAIDALLPADLKEELQKSPAGGPESGEDDSAGKTDDTDLSDWLHKAGTAVEGLLVDTLLNIELDGQSGDATGNGGDDSIQAPKVGKREQAPPAQVKVESRLRELEKANGELQKTVAEQAAEIKRLEEQLAQQGRLLKSAKAKVTQLKKGAVGGSSSMITGEITSTKKKDDSDGDGDKRLSVWKTGGDLSAAVAAKSGD